MDALVLTLKRKELPVRMVMQDGSEKQYTLVEMSGAQRDEYLEELSKNMQWENGNPTRMKKLEGLQAALLSRCLLDEESKPIAKETIQTFPSSAQVALFYAARKLNGIGHEQEEAGKND